MIVLIGGWRTWYGNDKSCGDCWLYFTRVFVGINLFPVQEAPIQPTVSTRGTTLSTGTAPLSIGAEPLFTVTETAPAFHRSEPVKQIWRSNEIQLLIFHTLLNKFLCLYTSPFNESFSEKVAIIVGTLDIYFEICLQKKVFAKTATTVCGPEVEYNMHAQTLRSSLVSSVLHMQALRFKYWEVRV